MNAKSAINIYKNSYVTQDNLSQVIMLYDAAITSIQQAIVSIENKDIAERFNKIQKAYLIMSGLRDCIDYERGGEVAQTLKKWYTETSMRIISINSSESIEMANLCIETIKQMRDTWSEARSASAESPSEVNLAPASNLNSPTSSSGSQMASFLSGINLDI